MLIETVLDGIVSLLQASVVMFFDDAPSTPQRPIESASSPSYTISSTANIESLNEQDSVDNLPSRILPPLPSDDEEDDEDDDEESTDLRDTVMLDYIRRQNPLLSSLLAVNSIDDDEPAEYPPRSSATPILDTHDAQDWTDDFVADV